MLINKSLESFKMRLVPNVQHCTSVGIEPGSFGSGVTVLTHYAYSNFGKQLEIYFRYSFHPRSPFGNEIIWKENYQEWNLLSKAKKVKNELAAPYDVAKYG